MPVRNQTETIAEFLGGIGIECRRGEIPEDTLLPGIYIDAGGIVYDRERMNYPGDLLHEAGHIATAPPSERAKMAGNLESTAGDEMAAIAWSFAACTHLGLDREVVFHAGGYKEGADSILGSFATEQPVGVPLLVWYGMTDLAADCEREGACVFPLMRSWLREVEDPSAG